MRKNLACIALLSMFFLVGKTVHAQQLDAAFGLSGLIGTPSSDASGDHFPQTVGGGVFPTITGDVLLAHHFGIGGEVFWRATQNVSQGFLPFRPIFYDFNAVFAPPVGKHAAIQVEGGIGGESVRFYQPFVTCSFFSCTNFTSSNHFLGHLGAGVKLYTVHHIFIRPEVGFYFINNNVEFSGPHATRIGASIGYTFAGYQ